MKKIETDYCIASYEDNQDIRDKVFEKVISYFKDFETFDGESICQSDNPMIEAPYYFASIADDIIKFDVEDK